MERLDDRARQAAASLRATVATGLEADGDDAPTLDTTARRRWPLLAAAAAVLLVAAAVAVLRIGGDDREPIVAGPGEGGLPVPRLVVDPVPDGMRVSQAADLPFRSDGDGPEPTVTLSLYGDPGADDPFAARDLGIHVAAAAQPAAVQSYDDADYGDPVTVRGREGWSYGGGVDGDASTLHWRETDLLTVGLTSFTLAVDELLVVAEALDLSDPLAPPGDELPGGLSLVASTSPSQPWMSDGAIVAYDGDRSSVSVTTARGSADLAVALTWQQRVVPREVTVRGRPGQSWYDTDSPGEPQGGLLWMERDDVLVMVTGWNLTEGELIDLAESLRPATDEEWDELTAAASAPPPDAIASGEAADGVTWYATVDADADGGPMLCVTADTAGNGFTSCTGYSMEGASYPVEVLDHTSSVTLDPIGTYGAVVFGRVAPDVAAVHLERDDFRQVLEVHAVEGLEERFFAGLWLHLGSVRVVALDAAGNELASEMILIEPEERGLPMPPPDDPDGIEVETRELRAGGRVEVHEVEVEAVPPPQPSG